MPAHTHVHTIEFYMQHLCMAVSANLRYGQRRERRVLLQQRSHGKVEAGQVRFQTKPDSGVSAQSSQGLFALLVVVGCPGGRKGRS